MPIYQTNDNTVLQVNLFVDLSILNHVFILSLDLQQTCCIYIYIYIVIHRRTISLYHTTSEWLDTQDASSWHRKPADFTVVGYLNPKLLPSQRKIKGFLTCIFIYIYAHWLSECSIHENSFIFVNIYTCAHTHTHTHIYIYI